MKRAERERIMRQGVVLPETPRDRRQREGLAEDLRSSPLVGQPLRLRLRNFRIGADGYLTSLGGPLPYMQRLREIEALTVARSSELERAWRSLAAECADSDEFERRWRAAAGSVSFVEVNDLIDRHNRWFPVETRLSMDPRTGDFALVNGRDYRLALRDAGWVLERFPADRGLATA
jgi:hypothetical protein